jgi:hypothetical protein
MRRQKLPAFTSQATPVAPPNPNPAGKRGPKARLGAARRFIFRCPSPFRKKPDAMPVQPSLIKRIHRGDRAGANSPRRRDGRGTMPAFNNLKTGTKLTAVFLAVALIIVGAAAVGYVSVKSINAGMATLYADRLLSAQQLGDANEALLKISMDLYKHIQVKHSLQRMQSL